MAAASLEGSAPCPSRSRRSSVAAKDRAAGGTSRRESVGQGLERLPLRHTEPRDQHNRVRSNWLTGQRGVRRRWRRGGGSAEENWPVARVWTRAPGSSRNRCRAAAASDSYSSRSGSMTSISNTPRTIITSSRFCAGFILVESCSEFACSWPGPPTLPSGSSSSS